MAPKAYSPRLASAKLACDHLAQPPEKDQQPDVGISPYETCLGDQANLTHPADRRLCELARSTMSANGNCVLGE
jgi:hypothetical protein